MNNNFYLLDTDTTSNYLDKRRANPNLRAKVEQTPSETIFISVVTFEEIIKGALSLLNSARKHPRNAAKVVEYFALFHNLIHDLAQF